ncbi:hypothetical protein [Gordonia malaquae]|uniref:hypothetical protein n=1 Tax=Gordonia malaquae TaxID=410332 RepID=UPI0030188651
MSTDVTDIDEDQIKDLVAKVGRLVDGIHGQTTKMKTVVDALHALPNVDPRIAPALADSRTKFKEAVDAAVKMVAKQADLADDTTKAINDLVNKIIDRDKQGAREMTEEGGGRDPREGKPGTDKKSGPPATDDPDATGGRGPAVQPPAPATEPPPNSGGRGPEVPGTGVNPTPHTGVEGTGQPGSSSSDGSTPGHPKSSYDPKTGTWNNI